MKKIIVSLLVVLIIPSLAVCEDDDYSNRPGYVDFDSLEGFKRSEKSVEVYLKKPLLSLVAALSGKEDPTLQQLLSNLELIRVEQFEIEPDEAAEIQKVINTFSKKMNSDKWDKLVKAVDHGEHVEIYIKTRETKIAGLLVMAMEQKTKVPPDAPVSGIPVKKEVTFINIVGEIDLAMLGKLGAKFNIPVLEDVKNLGAGDE